MVVALVTSAACSDQFRVAQESVEAEAELEQLVASHPSVAVANYRGIPEAVPYPAVVAASVLAVLVATAVCPSQVEESALAAFDLVVGVDCCRPSTALTAECWAV